MKVRMVAWSHRGEITIGRRGPFAIAKSPTGRDAGNAKLPTSAAAERLRRTFWRRVLIFSCCIHGPGVRENIQVFGKSPPRQGRPLAFGPETRRPLSVVGRTLLFGKVFLRCAAAAYRMGRHTAMRAPERRLPDLFLARRSSRGAGTDSSPRAFAGAAPGCSHSVRSRF